MSKGIEKMDGGWSKATDIDAAPEIGVRAETMEPGSCIRTANELLL